jgi:hypothetical protein
MSKAKSPFNHRLNGRARQQQPSNKKGKAEKRQDAISFSFRHLYKNSDYGYPFFEKHVTKQNVSIVAALFERLKQLSILTFTELHSLPKETGQEKIPLKLLNEGISAHLKEVIPNTEKATVIRFNNQKNRLIGYFEGSVLQIIAFDFGFNAYKH